MLLPSSGKADCVGVNKSGFSSTGWCGEMGWDAVCRDPPKFIPAPSMHTRKGMHNKPTSSRLHLVDIHVPRLFPPLHQPCPPSYPSIFLHNHCRPKCRLFFHSPPHPPPGQMLKQVKHALQQDRPPTPTVVWNRVVLGGRRKTKRRRAT